MKLKPRNKAQRELIRQAAVDGADEDTAWRNRMDQWLHETRKFIP